MTHAKPRKPQFERLSRVIRDKLTERGWSQQDLGRALGRGGVSPGALASHWLGARNAPGPDVRAKLAKLLGVTEDMLRAQPELAQPDAPRSGRPANGTQQLTKPVIKSTGDKDKIVDKAPTVKMMRMDLPAPPAQVAPREAPPFGFVLRSDGLVDITLNVRLHWKDGTALARMLMEVNALGHREEETPT